MEKIMLIKNWVLNNKELLSSAIFIILFVLSEIKSKTKSKKNSVILETVIDILKKLKSFLVKKK